MPTEQSRSLGRLSAEFVLTFLKSVAGVSGGDFIDGVIRMAILDANIRHLTADPERAQQYSSFELPVPDDLRRPASVNAISMSLGLPFETARRRIRAMHETGMCQVTDKGVILPQVQLQSEELRVFTLKTQAAVADLYRSAREIAPAIELIDPLAIDAPRTPGGPEESSRLIMRSTIGYVLRYLEAAEPVAGDLISAMMFLAVQVANVEHITHAKDLSRRYDAPQAVVPDDQRRRTTIQAISKGLGASFETTRRRINALVDRGVLMRDEQGLYVPSALLLTPVFAQVGRTNRANLQRLFTSLARLGVQFDNESDLASA